MEIKLNQPPTCMALGNNGLVALGSVDGSLKLKKFNSTKYTMKDGWKFDMNASIRDVVFDHDYFQLFCVSRNKAVCSYDVETGRRTRCLVSGTSDRPNVIGLLPQTARKHQQFATGDENGEVRTWDFRADKPLICTWKEQEGDINALAMDSRHNLLSASSDGSIAAYEVRKCKLRMKSEIMHSELLSLCVTNKYVYAGGIDGVIEVFTHGEYGNLLERIESGFDMGVNQIVQLRAGLLLTASEASSKLRLLNVMPTKRLGAVAMHGEHDEGIDKMQVTPDGDYLFSLSGMNSSLKVWPLEDIMAGIPLLRADNIQKRKSIVKEGFFDDLLVSKAKTPKNEVKNGYLMNSMGYEATSESELESSDDNESDDDESISDTKSDDSEEETADSDEDEEMEESDD